MITKRVFFAAILFVLLTALAFAQPLNLFGGHDHNVFLGCLNSGKYDVTSVWNKYGTYGSKYNPDSIWNQYGTFGSKYSTDSPWNAYGSNPPVIVDESGDFYGYFTVNKYFGKRTTIQRFLWILDNSEWIMNNFDDAVSKLFG